MVDVFEQVEEELRADRWKRLARKWGPVVGGVLALALIVALGFWGMDALKSSQGAKGAAAYDRGIEAAQGGNVAAAEAAFQEAEKAGNSAYKALALTQRAALAVQRNQIPQAIELFDQAARADRDPLLADQAVLKGTWLMMDQGATLEQIEGRLEPLLREGRPFRAFAQETQAMARLLHGKPAEARQVFVQLQLGQNVPDDVRQRAQAAVTAIDNGAAQSIADTAKAMARQPAPAGLPGAQQAPAPQP